VKASPETVWELSLVEAGLVADALEIAKDNASGRLADEIGRARVVIEAQLTHSLGAEIEGVLVVMNTRVAQYAAVGLEVLQEGEVGMKGETPERAAALASLVTETEGMR